MRLRRLIPTVAVLSVAAVALMVLAGAGSAARTPAPAKSMRGISLGSVGSGPAAMAKIKSYLRSVGVDPRTVVIQTGKRNYAGSKCPGVRWNCTTATRVLQAGSDNVFQCTPAGSVVNSPGNQSCVIMQNNPSGSNTATCTERSNSATAVQVCQITQVGRNNTANVNQVNGSNGTTQSGSQTATVNQSGATGANRANITQSIAQDASGAPTLMQDGWARADLIQSAMGNGQNIANVNQNIRQGMTGGTTHRQDTTPGSVGDCYPGSEPSTPNLCANVSQTAVGGDNTNILFQKLVEKASTNKVATQIQGNATSGVDGKVHQATGPSATNWNQANQNKIQSALAAPGSSQDQNDPARCCGVASQAGGNANNQESIGQGSAQDASENNATQDSALIGESVTPNGTCDITQGAASNDDSADNTARQSPCPFLVLETSCNVDGCTASDPILQFPGSPDSELSKAVRNDSQSDNEFATSTFAGNGDLIEFQVTYSNVGDGTAHDVVVSDPLPSSIVFSDCTGPGCSYNSDNRTVTWTLGDVAPDSDAVTLRVFGTYTPSECGEGAANTAQSSDQEDEGATSNEALVMQLC
jgi:uncharacterized repeat protein (TIGR01451 family)